MHKIKIFISSVQQEFAQERLLLHEYIISDALLGKFFEPFIFEKLPAIDKNAQNAFLNEVEQSDIYIGLFGKDYGNTDIHGLSATEKEYDYASKHYKNRLIFISNHKESERHPKVNDLIKKAENNVIRKRFNSDIALKTAVYVSLVSYLEENEFIRTCPFDAAPNKNAEITDLNPEKIKEFVVVSNAKRAFPLPPESSIEIILTHLNLIKSNTISNAAILLFGSQPQHFFLSSEVKCAHFHGYTIEKPIPSYQVYKGDVFQLVNQAVDFIMTRIDASVGTRDESISVTINYELPRAAVTEAIVNAVVHRDYTSKGSVQVMLFKDRLEIWNPGNLPYGLTTTKLKEPHTSIPNNPLLAEPMYLAGYIERMGTGTGDIIRLCKKQGLKEPDFIQDEIFKTVIWRKNSGEVTGELGGEVSGEVPEEVKRIIVVLSGELKRAEIQKKLDLKSDDYFRVNYIIPSLEGGFIEMKYPESPNHPNQQYRLTIKGKKLQIILSRK